MAKGCCQLDSGVRFVLQPSGYEPERRTLSLDDSIALTVRRPPKTNLYRRVLDASWT